MSTRSRKTLASLAFAVLSASSLLPVSPALAQSTEPPGRVGRIALTQGQVRIVAEPGVETSAAQVNWPVTTGTAITTAAGARTELRIGSIAIRLDGDSSLEVLALDDDNLQLRLAYGSASVRVVNPDTLAGFVLETPQARVRLQQPGRLRVDAERVRDTSAVTVFEGVAAVEGGGSQLTVRAGRRAEVGDEDVRTLAAQRDVFDDWSAQRDRAQEAPTAARYVGTEMTGYEELDRFGSWQVDNNYGALWMPNVAAGWVPYRDGSWAWLEPWGWTWVDNAPWGYAPFHYGRWVQVRNRWAWAPGGRPERPVWAPALVGWVGGGGWNATFRDRRTHPALGWYPLSPWERFEPAYRAREDHLRWLNGYVRQDWRPRDYRPQGLTVVPQDRFNRPGRIDVPRAPIATVPPVLVRDVPAAAPPVPRLPRIGQPGRPGMDRGRPGGDWADRNRPGNDRPGNDYRPGNDRPGNDRPGRDWPGRNDGGRFDRDGRIDTARVDGDGFVRQRPGTAQPIGGQTVVTPQVPGLVPPSAPVRPLPVTSPTPRQPNQPLPVTSPTPGTSPQDQPAQGQPQGWPGRPGRDRDEPGEWRRHRQPQSTPPQTPAPAVTTTITTGTPATPTAPPEPRNVLRTDQRDDNRFDRADRAERAERASRGGWERGRDPDGQSGNGMAAAMAARAAAQQQAAERAVRSTPPPAIAAQPPRPQPLPVMAPPSPVAAAAPAPRSAPAASRSEGSRSANHGGTRGPRQQER